MLTVAILINGNPIMARSAVNSGKTDENGWTLYKVDDGTEVWHCEKDGAVKLAIQLLGGIKEQK